ncbi:MAG: response regulator transcription factor [Opitutales bacterium]
MIKRDDESKSLIDEQENTPVILVVEDEADYRLLIGSDLQDEFEVVEVMNGKIGLEKALEIIPDLVVTDLMMPIMDGIELCRHLKAREETAHIPVVMLTAKDTVESQVDGFETGVDDYVTKPFNMDILRARISNLLRTRSLLRASYQRQLTEHVDGDPALAMLDVSTLDSRMDREFWERVGLILRDNHANPEFQVDLMASKLNMSQRSMQRKIRALVDLTPVQLIAEYRLIKVESLLKDLQLNVTDIAFEVGFGDLSHFYRVFKKKHGMSPSQYRDVNA